MSAFTILGGTIGAALLGLGVALRFSMRLARAEPGSAKMELIGNLIRRGAAAFLRKESLVIAGFGGLLLPLVYLLVDKGGVPLAAGCFLVGIMTSLAAGWIGMHIATRANVRTAQAAGSSLHRALHIIFLSGTTVGLTMTALGVLAPSLLLLTLLWNPDHSIIVVLRALTGLILGTSSVSLFTRLGGGIFTKAADISADLAGKVEAGIPEDDPRNPATIADNVGDIVGGVVGMGTDLYESYVASIVAAMIIGSHTLGTEAALLFPLAFAGIGILASIICTFVIGTEQQSVSIPGALRRGTVAVSLLMLLAVLPAVHLFFPAAVRGNIAVSVAAGIIVSVIIGFLTEYYTSWSFRPVQRIAKAAETGAATNVISGIALGYLSTGLSVFSIALAIGIAETAAGLYGIALAAVGMLSTLGIAMAAEAYGPIADNASGIAVMSGLPPGTRKITEQLDAAGTSVSAIGRGFAIGAAALTALTLFGAFSQASGLSVVDLLEPIVLIGILIGGVIPYLFSSLTLHAVGRAAAAMVQEVRCQFELPGGPLEGEGKANPIQCIAISTTTALWEMIPSGVLVLFAPVLVGLVLGSQALAGLLAGSLTTGTLLAISMVNSGSAWDNAKTLIEARNGKSKDTALHMAAVIGDTIGDPLKDTAGPALNILVKLMAIVALLTAELYTAGGVF